MLKEPAPDVNLTNFGADGLEFTVNYSMIDPENGQQNLRSQVNPAILKSLRAHQVEIPYPQRLIHSLDGLNETVQLKSAVPVAKSPEKSVTDGFQQNGDLSHPIME